MVVSKKDRAKRSKMLHILSDKKKEQFYLSHQNSVQEVLFESSLNGEISGWTQNYIKVNTTVNSTLENQMAKVHLDNFQNNMMLGIITD